MNSTCRYATKTINHAIVHLVDWMTAAYGEYAWKLALQEELAYLKGFTSPVTMFNITDDEFYILDELEDKRVILLLKLIHVTQEYLETLMLLYAVDIEAAYKDGEAIHLANKLFNEFMPEEDVSEELMEGIYFLVPCTINLWYVVAIVVMEAGYEFVKDDRGYDFLDEYYKCKYEELLQQLDKDDKNVALLVALMDNMDNILSGGDYDLDE